MILGSLALAVLGCLGAVAVDSSVLVCSGGSLFLGDASSVRLLLCGGTMSRGLALEGLGALVGAVVYGCFRSIPPSFLTSPFLYRVSLASHLSIKGVLFV